MKKGNKLNLNLNKEEEEKEEEEENAILCAVFALDCRTPLLCLI